MRTIQARRQLIVVLLLCTAAVAALVRHFAEPGSTVHTVSTVMMLLWLPVIGSIVGWCYGKLRRPAPAPAAPAGFPADRPFQPQALVEFTLRRPSVPVDDVPLPPGEHHCLLVVGHQGFLMRWQVAPGDLLRRGEAHRLPVEFLSPQLALPHVPDGTAFRMLVGEAFIGDGRVLQVPAGPLAG